MRIDTPFSTSSGVDPRSDTLTLIRSDSNDGNTSSGICVETLNNPANKMLISNKFAAT